MHCKHRHYDEHDDVRWCTRCGALQRRLAMLDGHGLWSRWSLPTRQRRGRRARAPRPPRRQLPLFN